MVSDEFGELVVQYYEPLFKFAFSLTRAEADASDLTQQTFYLWAKVKIYLFTALHRIFLKTWRRQARFPHRGLDEVASEDLPALYPPSNAHMDSAQLLKALAKVDEAYQGAVALFYLEDYSYREMAEILEVSQGTVKSRLARGITQLHQLIG
jgi:RNA polymerase sigma-70 factor (ECF subfamily)